ncbi:nucleotidyltransferase [Pasteurellaceae bacterium USgator11]|nr:nucleotidyltransferase [Pasteurellaceae bacterium USgator41]TNG96068.1 nucleotidyltransferase [Pasteurellaceae bacterium UScroc12]TNH00557.1 nucleotidyltransferase [Pasteurellaceae bacterium UScroc31]TNH03218.1 nucleotidyltransferase [Pasteurellaceae bacterium USgator11]
MQQDIRWLQRFENYQSAVAQLNDAVLQYRYTDIDIIKEGIIQRFEFTHELAWKLMKDILLAEGFQDVLGSRSATRMAFNQGLVSEGQIWLDMIDSRNRTVHTYNVQVLTEEFQKIVDVYLPQFLTFKDKVVRLCQTSV